MKVRRVYHARVECIEGWANLREAARRMHEGGFSCLPVVSGEDLLGIITERDLVEAIAEGEDPGNATVFAHMTEAPRTIRLDDDCTLAATKMLAMGCRHLPVTDAGRLVGIVSVRDLLPLATASS